MQAVLGSIVSFVLFAVGIVHCYWLFGGRKGFAIAVPFRQEGNTPLFTPRRFEIGAVVVMFWAAALLVLMYSGIVPAAGPSWLPGIAAWALGFVFAVRAIGEFHYLGLFKKYRDTAFAKMDSVFYSPLCLAMAAITFWMISL